MRKQGYAIFMAFILIFALTGCGNKSLLSAKEPVELTMWHVYGEQAGSPMDTLVEEFNRTEGKEKGVRVKVTELSSAAKIGGFLLETQGDSAQEMPDLFTCHIGDAIALGEDNLLDWNDWFTEQEQSEFVSGFLADGKADDGKLLVFPLSKSTQLLMFNGTGFARFSAATGVTYDDLSTWEGFYDAAGKFYDWTNGTEPFCAMDYPIRAVELCALEHGAEDFYTEDGWYDFDNAVFKESWMQFARALAQGHIVVSDLYSNTQVMTGEVLSGLGSSAAILYYNDTVTYEDGHSEPMDLQVVPLPMTAGAEPLMTQAGVGLCAYKTTEQKAEAASLFAHWLTEKQRNLDFVTSTGYMPVRNGAFDSIGEVEFADQSYANLYAALKTMQETYTPLAEVRFTDYYSRVHTLYDGLRQMQQELPRRAAAGEDVEALAEETWALFRSIQ